tara:strand:- start:1876 stop:2088 length:213 start_codon:yes stop_codon:yes gene_type:complete
MQRSVKQIVDMAIKKNISIVDVADKLIRQKKADKFIEDNANHLNKKHKKELKNVLVKFQNFLSQNGAELV